MYLVVVPCWSHSFLMTSFTPISTPILPFAKPEAPPPPVVVLLDATELHVHPPALLLAFEDLRPGSFKKSPKRTARQRVHFHPYNPKEVNAVPSSGRQPTPSLPCTNPHQVSALPPISPPADSPATDGLADTSPLSSLASSPSPRSSPVPDESRRFSLGIVSAKVRIERPKGAARKNLQDQVKWDSAFMASVKVPSVSLYST